MGQDTQSKLLASIGCWSALLSAVRGGEEGKPIVHAFSTKLTAKEIYKSSEARLRRRALEAISVQHEWAACQPGSAWHTQVREQLPDFTGGSGPLGPFSLRACPAKARLAASAAGACATSCIAPPLIVSLPTSAFDHWPGPKPLACAADGERRGVHLFHCKDRRGISAAITDLIASNKANMLKTDLHIDFDDEPSGYIARSEFSFDPNVWPMERMQSDFNALGRSYSARVNTLFVPAVHRRPRCAVLVSKQHHCLMELLLRWQQDELHVDIACVVSNHPISNDSTLGRTLQRNHVPFHQVPSLGALDSENNEQMRPHEQEVLELVRDSDFLVLARFMQARIETLLVVQRLLE